MPYVIPDGPHLTNARYGTDFFGVTAKRHPNPHAVKNEANDEPGFALLGQRHFGAHIHLEIAFLGMHCMLGGLGHPGWANPILNFALGFHVSLQVRLGITRLSLST